MKPQQIAKTSESSHQRAYFAWCAVAAQFGIQQTQDWVNGAKLPALGAYSPCIPLKWTHHIGNGGARGDDEETRQIRGGAMKAEGVKKGIGDIFIPCGRHGLCGLYIEMKKPSLKPKRQNTFGGLKPEQVKFRDYCLSNNFGYVVCYTWVEAVDVTISYLS